MESLEQLLEQYNKYKEMGLSIDMSRGKPCKEQLDISMPMLDILNGSSNLNDSEGNDCRNYGSLMGIEECRQLLSEIIEVNKENILIFGNSSLNVMYECIAEAMLFGIDGNIPWSKLEKVKWLCPVPGYDRHFAITEKFGFKMINIPMDQNGPDMNLVEELIKDPAVKGIWCVPKYSNPNGITYSEEVVKRFAHLKPAAKDFRIFWDNAYSVHHLYDEKQDFLLEILDECAKAGNPDLVYKFTSTSKISFPGSGIAALAASKHNIEQVKKHLSVETIGFDKVNQLRHVRFFKNIDGVHDHMKKHAEILRPKFDLVDKILSRDLAGIAKWNKPYGGYFVSLEVNGMAKEVVERCKNAGVILSPAGCAFPYHLDPENKYIRIAPSCLPLNQLEIALNILSISVKIESKLK